VCTPLKNTYFPGFINFVTTNINFAPGAVSEPCSVIAKVYVWPVLIVTVLHFIRTYLGMILRSCFLY
jgi:hypothetical protein